MEPEGIDEQFKRLAQNLEDLKAKIQAQREESERFRERQKRLDERERKARKALLAGIGEYQRIMNEGDAQ